MSVFKSHRFNRMFWIRLMCAVLGFLMVFSIIASILLSLSTEAYAAGNGVSETIGESDAVISVALDYAESAAQNCRFSAADGFIIKNDKYTRLVSSDEIIISVDGNEYLYNERITTTIPEGVRISIVGGYHVQISYMQSFTGETDSGKDNPVTIVPGASGGISQDHLFTETNINDYVTKFNEAESSLSLGVYSFPAYENGRYYLRVGSFENAEDAKALLSSLESHYRLNAEITEPEEGAITVHESGESYRILFETNNTESFLLTGRTGGTVRYNSDREYGGSFTAYARNDKNGNNKLTVINTLGIEDYIKAVMTVEFSETMPVEMLKAAAVIFRTQAYSRIKTHSADGFDVCDCNHCQVYTGCKIKSAVMSNIVDSVKGMIITRNNDVINAAFCRSAGSTTVSSADAFGEADGSLLSVRSIWEIKETDEVFADGAISVLPGELAVRLKNAGYGIEGNIRSITVNSRAEGSLYVTSMTLTDIFGNSCTVEGSENVRAALAGIVPSAAFIVAESGEKVSFSYYAEDGKISQAVRNMEGPVGNFVFMYEGEGTGVGLSLRGAEILAKDYLYNWQKILEEYYYEVEITDYKRL